MLHCSVLSWWMNDSSMVDNTTLRRVIGGIKLKLSTLLEDLPRGLLEEFQALVLTV